MKARMKVQAAAAALILGTSMAANAQLGGLSLPGASKGAPTASVDVDGFLKNAMSAEQLMRGSLDQLVASLASKEELAQIDALKKVASEKTDSKEKAVSEQAIIQSQTALLNTKDFDKIANEDAKKMDAKQKKKLAGAAYNFMLAALKDKELIGQSQSVISGLSGNPANINKLGTVKDTAGSLKTQLDLASSLATKVPKVFTAVGVKNPPAKASDAPVAIAD
jgi:hypothetical protein